MEYIKELRQYLGHKPILLVGAAVLVINKGQKLLLMKRSDNGCWGIPGGAMELAESLEDTARRETKEETGLDIGRLELFDVFSGPELFYEYPNGDQVYNVTAVYITAEYSGEIQLRESEHTEYDYFDLLDLPNPLSPPIEKILKQFTARRMDQEISR